MKTGDPYIIVQYEDPKLLVRQEKITKGFLQTEVRYPFVLTGKKVPLTSN